jgi:hypothetical protein
MFSITLNLACFKEAGKNIASDLDLAVFDPICMISPKQASMVAWLSCVWLEAEETIIYVEGGAEVKGRSFSLGVLAEEPAFTGVQVSIFIFREVEELNGLGLDLKGL